MGNKVTHLAHKEHPLSLTNLSSSYTCDGCRNIGSGPRYRCESCDLNLHESCAKCSEHISVFFHRHKLALIPEEVWKQWDRYNGYCKFCSEPMRGMLYRCDRCDFDLHLVCAQLLTVPDALAQRRPNTTPADPNAAYRRQRAINTTAKVAKFGVHVGLDVAKHMTGAPSPVGALGTLIGLCNRYCNR